MLLAIILCTIKGERLLVEREGFIKSCVEFHYSEEYKGPAICHFFFVPLYQLLTLHFKKHPQEEASGSSLTILLPSSLAYPVSHIISVHSFPLWSHCNLTPFTVPFYLDSAFLHPTSLPNIYKQSQFFYVSDIRRLLRWITFAFSDTNTPLHPS